MALLILLLLCFYAKATECNCPCEYDKWNLISATGTIPTFIGGHTMSEYKGNLYVFGGFKEDFAGGLNTYYNKLYQFDTCTGVWTLLDSGTGPSPRAFQTQITDTTNDQLLVFGGIKYTADFSSVVIYDDLWAWDLQLKQWSLLTNNKGPSARAEAGSVFMNDKMWVFGGVDSLFFTASNELWSYDVNYNKWTKENPTSNKKPAKRLSFTMVPNREQNNFYIFAGEKGADVGFASLNDTWFFSIDDNTWTDVTPSYNENLFEGRSNFLGATMMDQNFVLYGGEGPNGVSGCSAPFPQDATDETWTFNTRPHQRTWTQTMPSNTPPALKRHTAASVGNCMYIFGGWNFVCPGPGQVWNNDVYSLKI